MDVSGRRDRTHRVRRARNDGRVQIHGSGGVGKLEIRIAVAASVGDVDGDGLLDIVVGTTSEWCTRFAPGTARDANAGQSTWEIRFSRRWFSRSRPKKTGLDVLVATHEGAVPRCPGKCVASSSISTRSLRRAAGHVLRRSRRVGRCCLDDGGSRARVQGARLALSPDGFSPRPRLAVRSLVVLHERDYRVMRGSRVDVSYEIIDRRARSRQGVGDVPLVRRAFRWRWPTLTHRLATPRDAASSPFASRFHRRARDEIASSSSTLSASTPRTRTRRRFTTTTIRPQMARRRSVSPRHRRRDSSRRSRRSRARRPRRLHSHLHPRFARGMNEERTRNQGWRAMEASREE